MRFREYMERVNEGYFKDFPETPQLSHLIYLAGNQ
jgi:hypothetical protein